ncbi:hypothetical protein AB0I28_01220 [Phytomonospora sp. NPDC050363]|uniref:hypothetical protein n=1 Tax=Phytomonospora sp. NPDC050363 TaxID=3155642 RepID=UPI0033C9FBC6
MSTAWTPELELDERPDSCRLTLVGITHGDGVSLQAAGNDLLDRLFGLAVTIRRSSGGRPPVRGVHRPEVWHWLWHTGDLALRGGDLRARVFGEHEGSRAA